MKRVRKRSNRQLHNDAMERIKKLIISGSCPKKDENITKDYERSKSTLGEYVTLDWDHCCDTIKLKDEIIKYKNDQSRQRPLNIVMIAQPGSGKSHFIKCLAKKMSSEDVSNVTFNMANLQSRDDLIHPLDAARNLKVNDKFPLLFLDEFDTDESNYSLLLPLLWDGELHVGNRDLQLGKVVIILAGSDPDIDKVMREARKMKKEHLKGKAKMRDLLSRVNGPVFRIPKLGLVTTRRNRQVDKICLSISLLEKRFGERIELVSWALLRFIALSRFRYEARSIAHLIDLIPPIDDKSNAISCEDLKLKLNSANELKNSSLAYHLIADEEHEDRTDAINAIVNLWKDVKGCKTLVRFGSIID